MIMIFFCIYLPTNFLYLQKLIQDKICIYITHGFEILIEFNTFESMKYATILFCLVKNLKIL